MDPRRILEYAKLAPGLVAYLRDRPAPGDAAASVRRRLASRDERFLHLIESGVYATARSPYRKLLLDAGFPWARFRDRVLARGVEATLIELRDAGVFVSADDFKFRYGEFDNSVRNSSGVEGKTSGTTAAAVNVVYSWPFLAEEAENEQMLYECHGVAGAPTALWYPVHVSIAGIHNLLLDLRRGSPPERWFSQSAERGLRDTAMRWYISAVGSVTGVRAPAPENVAFEDAGHVVRWMSRAIERSGAAVLRTFASSAVRAAQAALAAGEDLRGGVVFAGGEPLGEAGLALVREAGLKAIPRYVTTEAGLIGAACPHCETPGEMHVYRDRVALIPGVDGESLLVTTLTPAAGKILLNASLGDFGVLHERECPCPFGELGMNFFVSGVHNREKFTQQGMAVEVRTLERIVGELVQQAGGAETDFQFWDRPGGALTIAVDPSLGPLDADRFISALLTRLRERSEGGPVEAAVWDGAGVLQLVREAPRLSAGQKLRRRIAVD